MLRISAILISIGVPVLLSATPTSSREFGVVVRVVCPAPIFSPGTGMPSRYDSSYQAISFSDVPCAGILVTAMDSDTEWDDHCGSAFTDSTGRVSFSAECSDDVFGGEPDVYLKISALSEMGFSVGTHDFGILDTIIAIFTPDFDLTEDIYDYLVSHATYEWLSPQKEICDEDDTCAPVLDWDTLVIGVEEERTGAGSRDVTSTAAARHFTALRYAMLSLSVGAPNHLPMTFNYTINHPTLGSPTTIWDTVIVDDDDLVDDLSTTPNEEPAEALQATAHELGHIIYNTYHSSWGHWLVDAVNNYTRNHNRCVEQTLILGWYEGFANFIRDYVNQGTFDRFNNLVEIPPRRCPGAIGLGFEGNNQAILDELYFGPARNVGPVPAEYSCQGSAYTLIGTPPLMECSWSYSAGCGVLSQQLRVDGGVNNADLCMTCTALTSPPVCTSAPSRCWRTPGMPIVKFGPDLCAGKQPAVFTPPNLPALPPRADGTSSVVLGRDVLPGPRLVLGLPSLDAVLGFVRAAGAGAHRAQDFKPTIFTSFCRGTNSPSGAPWYCNTTRSSTFLSAVSAFAPGYLP